MSHETLNFIPPQETFDRKERIEALSLNFNERGKNFSDPTLVAGKKINRILDKFTNPEIEDPKLARKEFVKITLGLFIVPSILGLIAGNFIGGLLVGLVVTGFYLLAIYFLKNG